MVGANLCFVEVDGADLTSAVLGDTLLVRIDFSRTRGLMQAKHRFDSIVDVITLEKTRQSLVDYPLRRPEIVSFFTACGVAGPYLKLFESLVSDDVTE
jgi:hypothetical protein